MDNDSIKANIKRIRERLDFTQKEVAQGIGLEEQKYRRIESGDTKVIHKDLPKIAEFFSVSLEELLLGFTPNEYASQELEDYKALYGEKLKENTQVWVDKNAELQKRVDSLEKQVTKLHQIIEDLTLNNTMLIKRLNNEEA